ncbi:MAG: hypothetical protein ACHQ4H_16310 [Ktedonobacterales bacterium]
MLVAVGLALLIHNWQAMPTYRIDAEQLLLTQTDVGPQFKETGEGNVGPAQQTHTPLPYQQQMISGRLREFMANSVLSTQGRQEIGAWEQQYGFAPTNPPTIMGPFVADHTGVLDVVSVVRSFQTEDAARQEYHCCHYVDLNLNFDESHTVPIHLGDEADGWTGISKSLSGPSISPAMPTSSAYQERGYSIHWRHGSIVTNVAVWGAHDVTLDDALRIAQRVDAHIVQALQVNTKEGLHANSVVDGSYSGGSALCAADRRTHPGFHRN